jgi:outer membrane protein assembly factor BamB
MPAMAPLSFQRRSSFQKTCPVCALASVSADQFCTGCGTSLANVPEDIPPPTGRRNQSTIPEFLLRGNEGRPIYEHEEVGTGIIWLGFLLLIVPAATGNISPLSLGAWISGIVLVLAGLWRAKINRQAIGRAGLVTAAVGVITLGVIINHVFDPADRGRSEAALIAEPTATMDEPEETTDSASAPEEDRFLSVIAMPRGGPDQRGVLPGPSLTGNPFRLWRYDTGDMLRSTPVIREDTAYVGTSDGFLLAIDLTDGQPKWRFDLGGYPVRSAPALGERIVYVGSGYTFFAIDAERGREVWRYTIGYAGESSPVVTGDTVYIASKEQQLYALDALTGERKWSYKSDGLLFGAPAVNDELVVMGGDNGDIFALSVEKGIVSWMVKTDAGIYSTLAIDGESVFVTLNDRRILALDLDTGEERWTYTVGGVASPASFDEMVIVGSDDGGIYALDHATGGPPDWLFATGDSQVRSPILAGDALYVAAGQSVFELDPATGEQRWRYPVGDVVTTDPVVADGVLYVGARDGYLYAITGDGTDSLPGTPESE